MMNVSVAGVAEKNGKYLVALRNPGTSIGVKWEFPGGKIEPGESPEQALIREYREELDISIRVGDKLCEGSFKNGSKDYKLKAYNIALESENYRMTEHQKIEWVSPEEMKELDFPDSDLVIVNYLLSR